MNEQQIGEIAEAVFKTRFGDVEVVKVDVRPGFDHCDAPMVDVNIIYDACTSKRIPLAFCAYVRRSSRRCDERWRAALAIRMSTSLLYPASASATPRQCDAMTGHVSRSAFACAVGARAGRMSICTGASRTGRHLPSRRTGPGCSRLTPATGSHRLRRHPPCSVRSALEMG